MEAWWEGLSAINRIFVVSSLFFSILFVWQVIGMFLGMDAHSVADSAGDHGFSGDSAHDVGHDHDTGHDDAAHSGAVAFTLVSIRSLVAFGLLFSWSGTLYLMSGIAFIWAVAYSFFWGFAGMLTVSFLIYKLLRLQETGDSTVWSALGEEGTVYMNIPSEGAGKVRIMVNGVLKFVDAHSVAGKPLEQGTKVRAVRIIDDKTVEVDEIRGV